MIRPIRRRLRNHFGLTAKQVAVRSHRPWYFQGTLAVINLLLGFALAYWALHDDNSQYVRERLRQVTSENIEFQKKLIASQRELQVELATSNNLAKTLTAQQDENIKLKEELVFYKKITKR
ncbi:hypothetical protein ASG24_12890 [Methylophilus sp. Leaf414]|jgi:hypothetical protein|nr:hypothetical protein ASG24_12890 [Methylophilus sp. Leaf414]KQT42590.1 hypothetical protein ASG34_07620 [Methylophilus sp. Leaf416]KQT56774.1 hypothetical protein ASG44_07595 [Methylophilus sp. Leaf459]